ncbi:MAG: hypothetical protein KME30_32175 [Iphinoe sp. HA4291-MV1]|jgi:hypothetical protein|nr:hypothetical protein [Iphinoe sp. HA4291-MV1]
MFTDITTALTVCKQYAGISLQDTKWDLALTTMLEASKAQPNIYRCFIVAALQIWSRSATSRGQLISADGVKWLTPKEIAEAIAGLLATQEALDTGLTIPPGWSVPEKRPLLCGCEKVSDTVGTPIFTAMIA